MLVDPCRSMLNQHRYCFGFADSPACICRHREESPQHYFLDCFLYSQERQTLFDLIEHYVPKFNRLNKREKLNIIIMGLNIDDIEYLHLNTILTKSVQNFIKDTKRFEILWPSPPSQYNIKFPSLAKLFDTKDNFNVLHQLSYSVHFFHTVITLFIVFTLFIYLLLQPKFIK